MADPAHIEAAARTAYIFGLSYIEMARTRAAYLHDGQPTGTFVHTRRLTTAADRWVTTPNNDTLYSSAWLNLGHGPVRLDTPEFGTRYWSVALMAMTTTNFAIPGTRTHGNHSGKFLIVGPGWEGDAGDRVLLRSPTNWVWALARIVVDGAADEEAVHGLQDGLMLKPTATQSPPALPAPLQKDDAADFYRQLAELLMESPPGDADREAVAACATIGLMSGRRFSTGGLSEAQVAALVKGFRDGVAQVRGGGAMGARRTVNGWTIPPADIGVFGSDYGLRASVALGGLAALPPAEAMYLSIGGPALTGAAQVRLSFAPGQTPPVGAFWSLTLYERTPEGRLFFFDNPLHRYAIGDRSHAMVKNADGSLDIFIQATPPVGHEGNWLPAPVGRFSLNLRAYLPKVGLLDGSWVVPALVVA